MTDPLDALRAMEPESPPREVVLASLRLFRYRVLAIASVVIVVVVGAIALAATLSGGALPDDVRAVVEHDRAEFRPATGAQQIGMVRVTVTEVVSSPSGNAVRLVFEDIGSPEREIQIDVLAIRQGSAVLSPFLNLPVLGRDTGRTTAAVWILIDPMADPYGAEIEVLILPIPDSVLDEGGTVSSDDGTTGMVTIERSTTP